MKKIIIIIVLLTTGCLLLTTNVMAQQVSLSISPPLEEILIKPGKSVVIGYQIENDGDPTILSAYVRPFEPGDTLGNIKIKDALEGPVRFSLDNSQIQLEKSFFVKTLDSQQLLLRIRIPEGTPEGDYYYSLLVESNPPTSNDTVSRARATIGSNILITVTNSGKLDLSGKVDLFNVMTRFTFNLFGNIIHIADSNDKIPVDLIIQNNGRNFVKPQGQITLRGNFGEEAKYDVVGDNILTGSKRLIVATPSAQIECEANRTAAACVHPASLILSGFFLGHYRLSATLSFADGAPPFFASTSFFAIPFKLVIGLFAAVAISILIVTKMRKKEEETV